MKLEIMDKRKRYIIDWLLSNSINVYELNECLTDVSIEMNKYR